MVERPLTLMQFIASREQGIVGARGDLNSVLSAIAFAGKAISWEVGRAGLADILGRAGKVNVQGEDVQKLDVFANDALTAALRYTRNVCVMGSEESADVISGGGATGNANYSVVFDPLDGSSNIDVAAPIGTIFGIYRRVTKGENADASDLLQPGRSLAAAGYIIYGSCTMFVYSTGQGVHMFTLDRGLGEFLLTTPDLRSHGKSKVYSVNEANSWGWHDADKRWVEHVKSPQPGVVYSARYIGSLVADFHRNLIKGGIFVYPADKKNPAGRLRLLYEAAPLAFVAEQAGGAASDGKRSILEIQPESLHQRTPLYIGSDEDVALAVKFQRATT